MAAAARAIGCDDVSYTDSVADACDAALATADDLVLATGSDVAGQAITSRPPFPSRSGPADGGRGDRAAVA